MGNLHLSTLLDEILKLFVGEVDAELIEGVGTIGRILPSRKTNEGDKVIAT
jgi:hypothetical protein